MFRNIEKTLSTKFGIVVRKADLSSDSDLYYHYYPRSSIEGRRFYNVSAGGHLGFGGRFDHPFWTNIDLDREWVGERNFDPSRDIAHDLLSGEPLPVEADSAEIIHSRYAIEHVTDEAALAFFREARRALRRGGLLRIVAPNIELDYRAYRRGDRSFFFWQPESISLEQAFILHFASCLSVKKVEGAPERITDEDFRGILDSMPFEEAMNSIVSRCSVERQRAHRADHINWWTPEKLESMVAEAGFDTVYLSAAEQSASPVLRNEVYFDNRFLKCMMYVEAIKN